MIDPTHNKQQLVLCKLYRSTFEHLLIDVIKYWLTDLPCSEHSPDKQCGLTGEEHPKESMVPLSDTVPQPGAVVVKPPHAVPTLVAVLGPHGLWTMTHTAVAASGIGCGR